jgi:hypothetical protein
MKMIDSRVGEFSSTLTALPHCHIRKQHNATKNRVG